MWFRMTLAAFAAALVAAVAWLGTHVSDTPTVLGRWSVSYAGALALLLSSATAALVYAGPRYDRVHRHRFNIALFVGTTVLSLMGAELAIRHFDLFGIGYYSDTEFYHRAKLPDSELYYMHEPNSVADYRGIGVRINSLGMRGEEIGPRRSGVLRVLFLGDSVTFGWGVQEEDIFVEHIRPLLSERLDRNVETLNAGVGSYNTENELAFLHRHGERLAPDVVALVYNLNDLELTPTEPFDPLAGARLDRMSPPRRVMWTVGRSWLYREIVHFARYGLSVAIDFQPSGLLESQGWKRSSDALSAMAEWCQARGIPFVTFYSRLISEPYGDTIFEGLQTTADAAGFSVLDTYRWFEDMDLRAVTNSTVDTHHNSRGHAVLADGMAAAIADLVAAQ